MKFPVNSRRRPQLRQPSLCCSPTLSSSVLTSSLPLKNKQPRWFGSKCASLSAFSPPSPQAGNKEGQEGTEALCCLQIHSQPLPIFSSGNFRSLTQLATLKRFVRSPLELLIPFQPSPCSLGPNVSCPISSNCDPGQSEEGEERGAKNSRLNYFQALAAVLPFLA